MNSNRIGIPKKQETSKEKRRRYKIHYNLRKRGNTINAWEKTIIAGHDDPDAIEIAWVNELINKGYGFTIPLFSDYNWLLI